MQIFKIEQNSDEWLQLRMGKIMGSKAKDIRPMARDSSRRYSGFWTILAEKIAEAPDGEPPIERGHRLENPALDALAEKCDLDIDKDPGVWISDIDDDMGLSPDGAERVDVEVGEVPTFAAEVKCLNSGAHIRYIINDMLAKKKPGYNPIYSVPNEETHFYRDQVVQYFVINKKLKTLYFTLYDDRMAMDHLVCYVITIKRENIEHLISDQEDREMDALVEMNALIAMLAEAGKEQTNGK